MKYLITISCLICLLAGPALAGQKNFSYQGVLVDSMGVNVPDGTYSITFNIHEHPAGGTAVWTKTQSVDVASGRFNTIIGENDDIILPYDRDYFLGISVGGDPEMTPRIELTAVPWAMYAHDVANGSITPLKIDDGVVVRKVNELTDSVTVAGGANVNVTTSNDSIIISSTAGGDADWTLNGNNMYSSPSGNVGIGTSNPSAKLEVNGTLTAYSQLFVRSNWVGVGRENLVGSEQFGIGFPSTSSYGGMYIQGGGPGAWPFYGYANVGGSSMWHYYEGSTGKWHVNNGSNRLTVQSNGNVGIGDTTPSYLLDVGGTFRAVGAATLVGGVSSVNSLNFPATTRYWSIPGNAFAPSNETTDFFRGSTGYIYVGSGGSTNLYAHVALPDNAIVSSIRAYIYDNNATYGATVYLYELAHTTTTSTTMAQVATTAANASTTLWGLSDTSVTPNDIDNINNSYSLRVNLNGGASSNLRLYSVRIGYTITQPLP
jgi:hypothetical protein